MTLPILTGDHNVSLLIEDHQHRNHDVQSTIWLRRLNPRELSVVNSLNFQCMNLPSFACRLLVLPWSSAQNCRTPERKTDRCAGRSLNPSVPKLQLSIQWWIVNPECPKQRFPSSVVIVNFEVQSSQSSQSSHSSTVWINVNERGKGFKTSCTEKWVQQKKDFTCPRRGRIFSQHCIRRILRSIRGHGSSVCQRRLWKIACASRGWIDFPGTLFSSALPLKCKSSLRWRMQRRFAFRLLRNDGANTMNNVLGLGFMTLSLFIYFQHACFTTYKLSRLLQVLCPRLVLKFPTRLPRTRTTLFIFHHQNTPFVRHVEFTDHRERIIVIPVAFAFYGTIITACGSTIALEATIIARLCFSWSILPQRAGMEPLCFSTLSTSH